MSLQIVNVFVRAKLSRNFDLNDKKALACHVWNAEFNPRRKSNVTLRLKRPPVTVDVSTNGFLAILGAENEDVARKAALKAAAKIKTLFVDIYIKWFRIENVVGTVNTGFEIQLMALARAHHSATAYEPELSTDLQFKLGEGFVAKIHKSGKITIMGTPLHLALAICKPKFLKVSWPTGGKSVAGAFRAWEELQPIVSQFKAAPSAPPPSMAPTYMVPGQQPGWGPRPVYAGQRHAHSQYAHHNNGPPAQLGQAGPGILPEDFIIDFPADFPMQ